MNDTKRPWTPGPWRCEDDDNEGFDAEECADRSIAGSVCAGRWYIARIWDGLGREAGSPEANAHLIAAAPDLYEALEEVTSLLLKTAHAIGWVSVGQDGCVVAAVAALAKARGEGAA